MDYKRIYADFIKDRRDKEPSLVGYSERHHILPKCMGGGNEASNLIRLTPEDHFFAHLLLAKAYGGTLWAPIAFMVNGTRKDYKPLKSRRSYAWASYAMAKAASGQNAWQYDWTIYSLEHADGRKWQGTQGQISKELGLTKPLANLLIKGRIGSGNGWFIEGNRPKHIGRGSPFGSGHAMYRPEKITFIHVDGRVFHGTQFEFHKETGVSKSSACLLARGKYSVANGWYVEGRGLPKTGRGARWAKQVNAG